MRETSVQFLGWEDSLEEGIETHSSILAWQAAVHGITKSQMWLGNEAQTIYEGNPLTSICQMGRELLELSPGLVAPDSTIFVCAAPPPPLGFPCGSDGKESTCDEEDPGSISGLGKSTGEGNGNPLQYSCLGNPCGQRCLVDYSPCGREDTKLSDSHIPSW